MIIATTYEQYKNLPMNRGKDSGTIYKEWLFEEAKLLMMVDGYQMAFTMQNSPFSMGVVGPGQSTAGGSTPPTPIPPIPTTKVTYYTPNGSDGVTLGYYTPDLDDSVNSYYIYV
jgi:hypothetical protein